MKKFATLALILILAITMTFSLAACGDGDVALIATPKPAPEVTPEPTPEVTPEPTPKPTPAPEPTPEPTPEPESEPKVVIRGNVEDGKYISEYLGFMLDFQSGGFSFVRDNETNAYGFLEEVPQSFWDEGYQIFELFVSSQSIGIGILFRKASNWETSTFDEVDFISRLPTSNTSGTNTLDYEFDPNQKPVTIGDSDWYYYAVEVTGSSPSYMVHYISFSGEILRNIYLRGPADLLDQFDLLSLVTQYP